jgi:hypothetical protein
MRRLTTSWTAALLVLSAVACSNDADDGAARSADDGSGPQTVVALGGTDTQAENLPDRLNDAWPYRTFRDAFPVSTVFVNGAVAEATAAEARRAQLPIVRELQPDVVLMWIGAEDMRFGTKPSAFARDLSRVVSGVQAAGVDRVLVGNLPAEYGDSARSYNNAIRHVVRETGAELVELDRERITLVDKPGFPPELDVAGHRVVAEAFGRRIASGDAPNAG